MLIYFISYWFNRFISNVNCKNQVFIYLFIFKERDKKTQRDKVDDNHFDIDSNIKELKIKPRISA